MCITINGALPKIQMSTYDFHKHFFFTHVLPCVYISCPTLLPLYDCHSYYKKSIIKVIVSQIGTSPVKFKIKTRAPELAKPTKEQGTTEFTYIFNNFDMLAYVSGILFPPKLLLSS